MPQITCAQLLFSQGFGARRECEGLIASGWFTLEGRLVRDPYTTIEQLHDGLGYTVRGEAWQYRETALLMLNKPRGVECSQKPKHHPSVYTLLPPPLRTRGVQSIGRLDEDTTGLLLFTDSGPLIHRLTSPKKHVHKTYEVGCKHPVSDEQIQRLLAGVTLVDDPATVRAVAAERTGAYAHGLAEDPPLHGLRLVLDEGKYHQVKRMLAAVGNRVERLHRSGFGDLRLPSDLPLGQWRWLNGVGDIVPAKAGSAQAGRSAGDAS